MDLKKYMFCATQAVLSLGLILHACPASAQNVPSVDAEARFDLLDKDGDGKVSWEEFSAVNSNITRQGFDMLDGGKDGFLTRDEWRVFSANHGMSVNMPSSSSTLPAKDPTMPLIMPPKAPVAPQVAQPRVDGPRVVSPSNAPQVNGPSMPLVTPPKAPVAPGAPNAEPSKAPKQDTMPPLSEVEAAASASQNTGNTPKQESAPDGIPSVLQTLPLVMPPEKN